MAISHSSKLLATGEGNGQVALWSLLAPAHPLRLATLRAGTGAVRGLSFSPAGAALAAAGTRLRRRSCMRRTEWR